MIDITSCCRTMSSIVRLYTSSNRTMKGFAKTLNKKLYHQFSVWFKLFLVQFGKHIRFMPLYKNRYVFFNAIWYFSRKFHHIYTHMLIVQKEMPIWDLVQEPRFSPYFVQFSLYAVTMVLDKFWTIITVMILLRKNSFVDIMLYHLMNKASMFWTMLACGFYWHFFPVAFFKGNIESYHKECWSR